MLLYYVTCAGWLPGRGLRDVYPGGLPVALQVVIMAIPAR